MDFMGRLQMRLKLMKMPKCHSFDLVRCSL